ncbi:trypsin-like peptidase domain-containing protein [Roseimicrobium sp. ORNL1]|uniref:trypsin-like peptidase domain-containing protein n=1 Tax=Roseimicrobium sp. ORNL1 TaxID=2711231 RepID=UPI0013E1AB98|nr:trypsin-like peptidase domain-containing protein [Roseimicrobium sp. ORNL1]QIF01480.1 trypsin-like serine protease [Roseimicrobium sp. ORNL1]
MRLFILPALWLALCPLLLSGKDQPEVTKTSPPSVSALTQASRPSIVTVTQYGRGGGQDALGTGFVIDKDGLIVTNLHVIGNARRLEVELSDGTKHEVTEVHATDADLDLAVLRISKKDLQPLTLGDSDKVEQGQDVVAIGHPQGLQFSVVEGVVSAVREVEGHPMIQVAIPIEEGNSGGPLMDREGRVQGVLTLKSAVTNNLGFARPINALRPLLEKPNPVPMKRWLTIGRLDPRAWEPLFNGRWTQHAGVIHANEQGQGLGMRTVCLNKEETPGLPFEVSVMVKLDEESGAAGLAFCSDGKDQHYGFYPSAGKMRLTRFNGPDVFSWTVLAEVSTPAYQQGTWNRLRVRVDEAKIQCYVNDTLVTEVEDAELRGGAVGLCKFRVPAAQFKRFHLGETAPQKAVPSQLAKELETELDQYLGNTVQRDSTMKKLLTEPVAARHLLESRAKELEKQVASLRELQKEMHRESIGQEISTLLRRPGDQTELLKAALLVARYDNPDVEIEPYLRGIERMVEELKGDPAIKSKSTSRAANRLVDYLFKENGFHGTRNDTIDDPSNSYLNEVLDDREGIPLTLSIVYLELARRLGLPEIHGVSLPGRFMVAYEESIPEVENKDKEKGKEKEAVKKKEEGAAATASTSAAVKEVKRQVYLDLFEGGKTLTSVEAEQFIEQSTGTEVLDEHRAPATSRAIILRLLHNLTSYAKKPELAMPYLDLIITVEPESHGDRLQRSLIRARMGDREGARADLKHLLDAEPEGYDLGKISALYESL